MRALDLDFRRTKGKVLWPGFALLACSLTVAILSAQQYQQLAEASEQAQTSLTKRSAAARRQVAAQHVEVDLAQFERDLRRARDALGAEASLAARNIPQIDILPVQGINVYDIVRREKLVLTRAALDALEARFK